MSNQSKAEYNLNQIIHNMPGTLKELLAKSKLSPHQFWYAIRRGIKRGIIKSNRKAYNQEVELL